MLQIQILDGGNINSEFLLKSRAKIWRIEFNQTISHWGPQHEIQVAADAWIWMLRYIPLVGSLLQYKAEKFNEAKERSCREPNSVLEINSELYAKYMLEGRKGFCKIQILKMISRPYEI